MKFSQVRLLVDDFGAAFRFYRDELGLGAGFGDESSGYASFATDGGSIAIFVRSGQGEVVDCASPGTRPSPCWRSTTSTRRSHA